jgi:hypothetical protein
VAKLIWANLAEKTPHSAHAVLEHQSGIAFIPYMKPPIAIKERPIKLSAKHSLFKHTTDAL